ncbi:MAG: ATP-dependent DNA helicase chl1 [Sclerophora amabilis]|nr:MAG: ATP-dependent DNA helicase chl1 [Sclerophora amabilis]
MSPMNDYVNHLFGYIAPDQIKTFSFGHVIPPQNLIAWPIAKGPGGHEFEFTFEKRKSTPMMEELGRAILNICRVIPDGVVVFFPSYAYLKQMVQCWQRKPDINVLSIWERLAQRKQVGSSPISHRLRSDFENPQLFQESPSSPGQDDTLQSYTVAIDSGKGGLLLSVVGGKMSEGINFSDRLGRGVIIVGLPFPNIHSAAWKAKLQYIEKSTYDRSLGEITGPTKNPAMNEKSLQEKAKAAGRDFYQNACMRAVNQSIGRAIRHQNDYAAIVLLDKRFATERISSKLPGWIQGGLIEGAGQKSFAEGMGKLAAFFGKKRG